MYELLDPFFNLPAIVVGIRTEFWDRPKPLPKKLQAVAEIWRQLKLIDEDGQLTEQGHAVSMHGMNLAQYYVDVLPIMMNADYETDLQSTISKESYQTLRNALADYHAHFIAPYFWSALGYPGDQAGHLVDVCGGAGLYSMSWLKGAIGKTSRSALVLDRPGVKVVADDEDESGPEFQPVDVFDSGDWAEPLTATADVVLLSEILHCKSAVERAWLVDKALTVVKKGGSIVVNERHPNSVFNWRMSVLTRHGKSLDTREIAELMIGKKLTQHSSWSSSHYHATRWVEA